MTSHPICGNVVKGCVVDGVLNGQGTVVQPQGTVFEGLFKNNEFTCGLVIFAKGGWYEGEWQDGAAHGQGSKTLPNGDTYSGSWVRGTPHGFGTEVKAFGERYQGSFVHGVKHGEGAQTLPCGATYSGAYENGTPHGFGTLHRRGARAHTYTGFFCKGQKQGFGYEQDKDGVYFGRFHANERSGFGVQTSVGEFRGMWKQNSANGQGVWRDDEGTTIISGEFKDGLMHGHGVAQFADSTHEGAWFKGVKHGSGLVSLAHGGALSGVWRDGVLLTPEEVQQGEVAGILCDMRMKRRSVRLLNSNTNEKLRECLSQLADTSEGARLEEYALEAYALDTDYVPRTKRARLAIVPLASAPLKGTTFEKDKYMVFPRAVEVSPSLLKLVSSTRQRKRGGLSAIFNGSELGSQEDAKGEGENDNKRLQAPIAIELKTHLFGFESLIESVPELRGTVLSPWQLLVSKPGCAPQAPHADWDPQPNVHKAFACLVAIQDGTTLDVFPGFKIGERTQVCLSKGDVLMFRGDLIHAGSAYCKRNARLHVYFDSPEVVRTENRVWKVAGN